MGVPLHNQRSGNCLSRKTWTWWERWSVASSNWKTVPTGAWYWILDVCCATYWCPHWDLWAHKKLNKVQSLKMYRFLWYTLWLKIYNVFILLAF